MITMDSSAEHVQVRAPEKTGQIDGLQVLRAVAVFLVAWLHSGQTLEGWRVVELPHFGAFGIDIFFVISGFIMSTLLLRMHHAPGLSAMWGFLKLRLIRIYPIYWVFALLAAGRLLHGHGLFLQNYFPSLLLLPGRYPLLLSFSWTMVFEMFFYYTLAAILLVTVKRVVPVAIAFFASSVLLGELLGIEPTFASPLLLEFVFGAVAALAFVRFGPRRRLGIAMLTVGAAISLYLRAYPLQGGAAGIGMAASSIGAIRHVMTWGIGAALIVFGVVCWMPTVQSLPGRIAVILGNASYSAYLASAIVLELAGRLLVKVGGPASIGKQAVFQLAMVGMVFVVGWISYRLVERPIIHWLKERV